MKILLVSDEEDPYLWDYLPPGGLRDIGLILSAGDLKPEYLSYLVTMANCPLLYVHGNHDGCYDKTPPEGCECVDDRILSVCGLRVMGLGGSLKYNGGPYQYTERQMRRRIRRLRMQCLRRGAPDIILTHAPVRGYGDEEHISHRGFEAFLPLLDELRPRYLIHGHVHQRYQPGQQRVRSYGTTTIINANGKYILELADAAAPADTEARATGNFLRKRH